MLAANDVANSVAADVKSPIAHVTVEATETLGASASRVRIALSQPVAHHVRSERNTVVVDFDRPSAKAAPYALPPTSRQLANGSQPASAPDAMMALQSAPAPDPIAALGLAMAELDYFWIANVIYLAFVLSSVLGSAAKIVGYRRGFQPW